MNARECIPRDKHDLLAIERARELGFPSLNEALPELLEQLQDGNWPTAQPTASLLINAGPEIIPHIKEILNGTDGSWKYFLIELLIRNLSLDLRLELKGDLVRLAEQPTQDDKHDQVDIQAQEVLATGLPEH